MQVSVDAINGNLIDRFVICHRFIVESRYIDDIAICLHQIDIGILINGYQALGLLAPGDMSDVGIAEAIDFIVGDDALIVQMILIEIV